MKRHLKQTQGIAKLFMLAKSEERVADLLEDLLTETEIKKAHDRAKIIACLKDGLSQRETQKRTKAAIATVTHGAVFLRKSGRVIAGILDTAQKMSWWNPLFWRA